jgi:uncharacterized membrane protein YkvA (DUF1232 family)
VCLAEELSPVQITVAVRTTLLKEFCRLAKEWREDDAVLIAATSKWAAGLRIAFGFEDNLTRDIIFLGDMLRRTDATNELAELARGGLAFVYENNCRRDRVATNSLGLLDDAFVAGYAAHLVREKLGEPARYSPPQLSPEEKTKAEDLFLELLDRSADEDERLPAKAQAALGQLGHLLESGLFRRLRVNVQFLAGVLRDSGRPEDHRQIARAALHYVSLGNDVIPDQLGLIGFLDDYFVADLAADLIDADRPPWLNLIDATVAAWPFLNMVVFEDGQGGIPLSEFLLVNTALTCPAVRGDNPQPTTHLILPRTGPLPLLLGFLASLGGLWKVRMEKGNQMPFQPGQKVLVDGKAVRTFAGCRPYEGRMLFGLEKVRKERNQNLRSIEWLPLDQLYRLVPTDTERITRGKIERQDHQPLQALDYLFLSAEPVTIPKDVPQIVVSSPVKTCKETAEAVSLFGQKLTEVIPIGHLTPGGEVCPWSSRFGSSRPAVLIIPDLDRACEYVEREGEKVLLTVVDATGHNAGRTASLARLGSLGARVLVVTSQADADESLTEETDATIWEWKQEDIVSLLSETVHSGTSDQAGPVRRYETEVVRALSAAVDVVQVHAGGVTEAFEAVRELEKHVAGRGEEVPPELENALDMSFNVLSRLLRCPFRLADHPHLLADLTGKLDSIAGTMAAKAFLTAREVQAVKQAEDHLRKLCETFQRNNPKADALSQLKLTSGPVTVLCGDGDLLEGVDGLTVCPVTTALDLIPCDPNTVYVISGWFGRGTMTRLLRPPFASLLRLILYEIEVGWYRAFIRRTQRNAAARRTRACQSRLFPGISGWAEARGEPADGESPGPEPAGVDPLDKVEIRLVARRRGRLTVLARPSSEEAAVEARLVLFDGGHAFLTDDYQAKVATHLLDPSGDKKDAELELVPARQLRPGDVLLFLRGSPHDVIREEADKLLPPGERERAGLWRVALEKYQREHKLSIVDLCQRLKAHSCSVGDQAIRNWLRDEIIAPLKYERDIKAIRDMTNDPDLIEQFQGCLDAVSNVRSAHLRAGRQLARRVLDSAVTRLKSSRGGPVDLGDGIVLVRVTGVDDSLVRIKATAANRFVEG